MGRYREVQGGIRRYREVWGDLHPAIEREACAALGGGLRSQGSAAEEERCERRHLASWCGWRAGRGEGQMRRVESGGGEARQATT